jgi:ATPase family AAA domain-containing protein 2
MGLVLTLLQALCTEAALNAVQRRYPQIYKSNDRLLLKPESIEVGLRDFMISIKSQSHCLRLHF